MTAPSALPPAPARARTLIGRRERRHQGRDDQPQDRQGREGGEAQAGEEHAVELPGDLARDGRHVGRRRRA